jgi:tetratricopeptide (TPR) repeat protein
VERLAILPANLLISDPSSEWLKVGVPIVLEQDLLTARGLIPGFAPDETGSAQTGATRVLRTSVENRNGGLHIECTTVDNATHKVVKVDSADATSAAVLLPALNSLAKKLDAGAIEFPTKSTAAWQALATAEATNNPQQRAQFLNQAINQDQNFGLAWVSLLEMIAPNRQTNLKHMIDDARARRNSFSAFDRARFDVAMSRLDNTPPGAQIQFDKTVLAMAPNDLDVLTVLGNNQILNGDGAGGEESLRRAASMNPMNVGLRFQLARGLMERKKFKEAEGVFSSIEKTPAVYPELATCILLEGDKTRADTVAEKFVASLQNQELKPLFRAVWAVVSGDRQKGIDLVLASKFKTPQLASIALSEAVVWQLMGGDSVAAQKTIGMLTQTAGPSVALPQITSLLADKTSPSADWQSKVQSISLPDNLKQPILAYGFFLRGNYADAAKAWQQVDDETHGTDLRARAMLAASLERAGKPGGGRIVLLPFTPEFADLYSAISFSELRRLLGKA